VVARSLLVGVLLIIAAACAATAERAPLLTVRVATLSPLSERFEAQGQALMQAARLAVEESAGRLARRGLAVELAAFDDRGRADAGVDEARRIVADPAVLAVVGPLTSDVALPVAPVFAEAGLAMVSPSATHPALTGRGHANVFRVCGRDDIQTEVAARFVGRTLGARTVHVVHDGTVYGRDNAESFRDAAARRGLTVVAVDEAPGDPGALAAAIKARDADVLYFAGDDEVGGRLLKAVRAVGVTARFVGSDGVDSPDFARAAGDAAEGAYYTSVAGPIAVHPQARTFTEAYRKRFSREPEPFAAQAYDATEVVLEALASAARRGAPSRPAVVRALREVRHVGYTGHIAFDARGDLRRALYLVMRVGGGDPDDWDDNHELKRLGIAPPDP